MAFINTLYNLWPSGDKLIPGLRDGIAKAAPTVFPKYGISSNLLISHLMAQISLECGAGTEPAASYEAGIGMDVTNAISSTDASINFDSLNIQNGLPFPTNLVVPPYAGMHTFYCIERSGDGSSGGTVSVFSGVRETFL